MTAEEFLTRDELFLQPLTEKEKDIYLLVGINHNDYVQAMIDYAKYHVELATQAILKKAIIKDNMDCWRNCSCNQPCQIIDRDSITSAYPLTNIK